MKKQHIEDAALEQLISAYREAARQHGDATEKGDHRTANKSAELIAAIYSELRRRGSEAQRHLMPLLVDPIPAVRVWAAAHALEFAPAEGETVLKELILQPRLVGMDAEMTLREWRAGRLRFP